jgi:hypothetical protein
MFTSSESKETINIDAVTEASKMHYTVSPEILYEGVSKSIRTGRLERELQMVQLSASRCSCIDIMWVGILSVATITLLLLLKECLLL